MKRAERLLFARATQIAAGLVTFIGGTRDGHGQDGSSQRCEVRVTPAAEGSWAPAVRAVRERARGSHDCRELAIVLSDKSARVVLITRDQRRAERVVETPAGLVSAVDALLVTLPDPSAPTESTLLTATESATAPSATAPDAAAPPAIAATTLDGSPPASSEPRVHSAAPIPAESVPGRPRAPLRAILMLGAGGRLGFPSSYISPTFAASAGVSVSYWELWATGQWDAVYVRAGLPSGFRRSSVYVGAGAGRRQPMGSIALLGGVTGGLSIDHESFSTDAPPASGTDQQGQNGQSGEQNTDGQDATTDSTRTTHTTSRVEPHAGVYVGAVFPREARVRFRPQVGADFVVSRIGRELTVDPSFAPLPWWSVGLLLSVEGAFP